MDCTFDQLSQEHENEVMDIFNYYTENTCYAYPEGRLPNAFFSMFMGLAKAYPAYAIKYDSDIIGFCLLRPYNPMSAFKRTAEVSYFIKKEFTGKGFGSMALQRLEAEAKKMGIKVLLADISSENRDSIKFHLKNGFSRCGLFHKAGFKFGKHFDVVWMEKELG